MRQTPLLVLVLMSACDPPPDDPVSSARAFIALARAGECAKSWPLYTRASQRELERRSRKELSVYDAKYAEMFAPHNLECRPRASFLGKTVRETARRGDTAVLTVISREGTRFPIIPFLSSKLTETPWEMRLAREDGRWKVVVPPPPPDPHRHILEQGRFTTEWARNRPTDRGGTRANGRLHATPEAIESVFLDIESWPRWVPHLVESRALTPPDSMRRQLVYGRYQLPGDTASVDYVFELTNSRRVGDSEARNFGASWRVVPRGDLPVSPGVTRLISWGAQLSLRVEMRVTGPLGVEAAYGYSGLPGEWPARLADSVFVTGYAARMLEALEREALKRGPP